MGKGREGEGDEYDDGEAEFELWLAARTRPRDSIAFSSADVSVRSALSEPASSSSSGVACAVVAPAGGRTSVVFAIVSS